ncbi:hypothetical protein ACFSQ7_50355 [Paenibacillus rhizoplanae]
MADSILHFQVLRPVRQGDPHPGGLRRRYGLLALSEVRQQRAVITKSVNSQPAA